MENNWFKLFVINRRPCDWTTSATGLRIKTQLSEPILTPLLNLEIDFSSILLSFHVSLSAALSSTDPWCLHTMIMCLWNETQNHFALCHKGEINDEKKYQKINLVGIGVYRIGKHWQSKNARVHTNWHTRTNAATTTEAPRHFCGFNVKQLTIMLQFSVSFEFWLSPACLTIAGDVTNKKKTSIVFRSHFSFQSNGMAKRMQEMQNRDETICRVFFISLQ